MTRTNDAGETRVGAAVPNADTHESDAQPVYPHTMRLQRFLARAGVASRRGSEDLMTAGRVTVNGEDATELGTKVDVDRRGRRHARHAQPRRRVPDALQADRLPHHHERSAGAPLRGRPGPARSLSGALPGGSPGPRHHGSFALYHRRRPIAGSAAPQQACLQDLPGARGRQPDRSRLRTTPSRHRARCAASSTRARQRPWLRKA